MQSTAFRLPAGRELQQQATSVTLEQFCWKEPKNCRLLCSCELKMQRAWLPVQELDLAASVRAAAGFFAGVLTVDIIMSASLLRIPGGHL
jgi:hypothetical protein